MAEIGRRLDDHYGPRRWRSHGNAVDELVGTILSQNTSDINTARSFASLRERFPTWDDVIDAPTELIADAIRSGGLANRKAPRIQAILTAINERFGAFSLQHLKEMPVEDARAELTSLNGVGPKTAGCVLLFSFGMSAMPVDTHVYRVGQRLGLLRRSERPEKAHQPFEQNLGDDRDAVYAFHLNLIAHGRAVCQARRPQCERCIVADCCDYFNERNDWSLASDRDSSDRR